MHDLASFQLGDMALCGAALRKLGSGAESMEEVANRIVCYLRDSLVDSTGAKACALVRFFKTHPYEELPAELREVADGMLSDQLSSQKVQCLTLLGTTGEKPEWNERTSSIGHRAIPLPSKNIVSSFPMISQLVHQLGLEIGTVLKPDPVLLVEMDQKTYNVFHVQEAVGSACIPAQEDFVIPFGIQSVLGFGGLLPSGNLFAIILFSRVSIKRAVAQMFRPMALSTKLAVLPFEEVVFA